MNESSTLQKSPGLDLLRFGPVRGLIRWGGFPHVFQGLILAAYVALAWIGWGLLTPEGVNAKLYAKANLVNLVIWGLWWPAMVWAAVLLGRVWCAVCPLEWVMGLCERARDALGLRGRAVGGWLASGGIAVGLFVVLQLLVPGVQLHRVPHYTSLFLLALLAGAAVAGLLFRDRAFCRAFCPIAVLLNAYGRGGMIAVRGGTGESGCGPQGERGGRLGARDCPSRLNPPKLDSNKDCLVCCRCIEAGDDGGMRLLLRVPFSRADSREPVASWPVTAFVMVVSGFVMYELCGVWKAADAVFQWVPKSASSALGLTAAAGWAQGIWTVFIVPAVIWLALGALALALGAGRTLGDAWRRLALPMAVVIAAGHMAKGLEKFTSWAGYLPMAVADPDGVQTAAGIASKSIAQPAPWLSAGALSLAACVLVGGSIPIAMREARFADPGGSLSHRVPIAMLGGLYLFVVAGWGL